MDGIGAAKERFADFLSRNQMMKLINKIAGEEFISPAKVRERDPFKSLENILNMVTNKKEEYEQELEKRKDGQKLTMVQTVST